MNFKVSALQVLSYFDISYGITQLDVTVITGIRYLCFRYCLYILQHLAMLPVDSEARWKKCRKLIYLHFMMTLYKQSPSTLNRTSKYAQDVLSQLTSLSI